MKYGGDLSNQNLMEKNRLPIYKCSFLLFWISRVETNIARHNVTILQVGINAS